MTGIRFNLEAAKTLLELFGGEESFVRVNYETEGHSGPGLYAYHAEYPDDGSWFLGDPPRSCLVMWIDHADRRQRAIGFGLRDALNAVKPEPT